VGFVDEVEVLVGLGFAVAVGVLEALVDDAVGFGDLLALADGVGVGVAVVVAGGSVFVAVGVGVGVGVDDVDVRVAVGVGVGVDDVDVRVAVGVGVGVGDEVGGGSVDLTGWHDWLPVAVTASSAAMA
jgi:hypothetical protein